MAAVEKIEVKREPEDFFGNRNRMSQPTWLFRRKATPLASTIHSHVQWDINENASWSTFTDHEAYLLVVSRKAICDEISGFWELTSLES